MKTSLTLLLLITMTSLIVGHFTESSANNAIGYNQCPIGFDEDYKALVYVLQSPTRYERNFFIGMKQIDATGIGSILEDDWTKRLIIFMESKGVSRVMDPVSCARLIEIANDNDISQDEGYHFALFKYIDHFIVMKLPDPMSDNQINTGLVLYKNYNVAGTKFEW